MKPYATRIEDWDKAVARVGVPGPDNSLDLVIALLEKQLDRAVDAAKSTDDKAALVVPGVAAIAGIFGASIRSDLGSQPLLVLLAAGWAVAAVAAIVLALWVMRPRDRSNGPLALQAVEGTVEPSRAGKTSYAKSLGFAVESCEDLALQKAYWMTMSLVTGGVGVMLLTAFAVLGGFSSGGGAGK